MKERVSTILLTWYITWYLRSETKPGRKFSFITQEFYNVSEEGRTLRLQSLVIPTVIPRDALECSEEQKRD